MVPDKKIVVVLPAYNAAKTLERTLFAIPKDWIDDIILVDDASKDNTAEVSKKLGLKTIIHKKNLGYGGNQKTCYQEPENWRRISWLCFIRISNMILLLFRK